MGFMHRVKVMLGLADEFDDEYEDDDDLEEYDEEYEDDEAEDAEVKDEEKTHA